MRSAARTLPFGPQLALARVALVLIGGLMVAGTAFTALVVPNEMKQPGTQPLEVGALESPNRCDNCHGGYDRAVEPAFNWRGSMMANAGRDPVFWAALAVAEQDFPGAGNFCIRCHSTAGWFAGRAVPTDGSGLAAGDADGVDCDTCHKSTNPDNTEHRGVMNPPYVANDEQSPATGYRGSGMLSLWSGNEKLGPYANVNPPHGFRQSRFHRDVDFCGSCHDVSNPAVGDLAQNHGKQATADPVVASGTPGSPVGGKAAFNNFPYKYGVVERTFSEYKAGLLSKTLVADYATLPADLKAGAIKAAFDNAGGNYADGTPRYFSCQTCHLRPVTGRGAGTMMMSNPPVRSDLPLHDLTGGNTWVPDVILYQNSRGTLRLGGGMTATQIDAVTAGKERARQQLRLAASLAVSGNTLKVTNLTGHKLISGYPEGRRMWLNVKWYDASDALVREDGRYGDLAVTTPGAPATVKTILDLGGANTKIYETHYAMTQEWAGQLLALGYPASLPLSFDRRSGAVAYTLGQLASQAPGTYHETFHFVLNNHVAKDNRIPPYGMSYDEARKRNALPAPAAQYGSPGPGGTFRHWDEVALNPPAGATRAAIDLLYQTASWEYIQFLHLANDRSNAFLANEGANLLDAWANTGMSAPVVMASAVWVAPVVPAFALTVTKSGNGVGLVTSTPAGIDCGATCSATFTQGTAVALTATADTGATFTGWSGGGCSGTGTCNVTMGSDQAVTATFAMQQFPLTVTKSGGGAGLVTSTPSGIDCGATCRASFESGVSVSLGAAPDGNSFFAGWSDACTGPGACNVAMNVARSVTATFKLNTTIPRLANIATRMQVLQGNDVVIGGFVIGGARPKSVVVRARGPSLASAGVPGTLQDPLLQLFSGQASLAANDDWQQAANASTVQSAGFAPADPRESAIMTTLAPGPYTAIVSGVGGTTGVGIVEVFEVDRPEVPLVNIATRGKVLTGADVMIGGFIIQGDAPQSVIVRARGPSLAAAGVTGTLQDPVLQLFAGQAQIGMNDDWLADPNASEIQSRGFAPADPRESAILVTLPPGAYTVIVTGKGGTTGVGIVEVFAQ